MATVTKQSILNYGENEVTFTTLDGSSDQFVIGTTATQVLLIKNDSGGAISGVSMIGDGAPATAVIDGIGEVTPSGYTIASIADGEDFVVPISLYSQLFKGTVAITGGTGLKVALLESSKS